MKTNNTLLLKKTYAVPINLLWQVLTEKEHQKQWYFDFGEDWRLEIGAVFQYNHTMNHNLLWHRTNQPC